MIYVDVHDRRKTWISFIAFLLLEFLLITASFAAWCAAERLQAQSPSPNMGTWACARRAHDGWARYRVCGAERGIDKNYFPIPISWKPGGLMLST